MIEDELISLTQEYEDKIYDTLIKMVEEAAIFAKENKYDDIDTFVYIQGILNNAYDTLSDTLNTSALENYLWLMEHFPNVELKISDYIEPFVEKARKQLQIKASLVLNATTYFELDDAYKDFTNFIMNKKINDYDFLFDGLEIDKKYIDAKNSYGLCLRKK